MIRIFGKESFYLKDAYVIESLSRADTLVFDKTGTITANNASEIQLFGHSPFKDRDDGDQSGSEIFKSPIESERCTSIFQVRQSMRLKALPSIWARGFQGSAWT